MRRDRVALLLLVFLVVIPSVGGLLAAVGWGSILVVSGLALIGILATAIAIKRYRAERSDDRDEGSWSIIPDWQYEGRFVEAGGVTRSEQSEAIEEVQTDADEIGRDRK